MFSAVTSPDKGESLDIGAFLTPPTKGNNSEIKDDNSVDKDDNWADTDTPSTFGLDGSYRQVWGFWMYFNFLMNILWHI